MTWDPFLESPGNLAMPGWRPYPKIMILPRTLAHKPVLLLKHYYQNLTLGLWIYCKHKIAFLGTVNTGTLLESLVCAHMETRRNVVGHSPYSDSCLSWAWETWVRCKISECQQQLQQYKTHNPSQSCDTEDQPNQMITLPASCLTFVIWHPGLKTLSASLPGFIQDTNIPGFPGM